MLWKSKRQKNANAAGASDRTAQRRRATAAKIVRGTRDSVSRKLVRGESLEARRLMAADPIHVGVVYIETDYLETDQDVGGDSQGDRFILSFNGGADDTELKELRITTDKDGDGISVGDPIYDTEPGGRGKNGNHGFEVVRVVTSDGRSVNATAEVADGGQELVLRLSNFKAGDRLEFTLDVDEVLRNAIDLAIFNDRLDVITSGQEFQDSILEATFDAPHYEAATADAIFLNDYGNPAASHGLNLPPDESDDVDSRPNRSAAAVGVIQQTPRPVSISGHVWVDNDLDLVREPSEELLSGVTLELFQRNSSGQFQATGHRTSTNAQGLYTFPKSLGLLPGEYRVVETQPSGLFSVGAVSGTIEGRSVGSVENENALTNIIIVDGDTGAINYDFAEAQPAQLSGFVYRDDNDNGLRETGEPGLQGVRVQIIPLDTIQPQSTLIATTDGSGAYSFVGLAPGSYQVIELDQPVNLADGTDAAGTIDGQFVGVAQNPGDQIDAINLNGGDVGVEYNFGEVPLGELSGYVYLVAPGEDCTGDHDADGNTPLEGVDVILETMQGRFVAQTRTDSLGHYEFDDLLKGDYRIREITPPGLVDGASHVGVLNNIRVGTSINGGLIQDIMLTAGAIGREYNFCEASPATISGYVYHDQSDDGRRDAGEEGIAGTTLSLVDDGGNVVSTTRTNADGRYEFADVVPGDYSIVETQPNGYLDGKDTVGRIRGIRTGSIGNDGDSLTNVRLKQGDEGVQYNFGELLPASLAGRVHVDDDGDCIIDPGEELLAGVVVRLFDADGNEVASTTTDSNGAYQFSNLTPATYTVIEETPDGYFEGGATPGSAGGNSDGPNRIGEVTLTSGEVAVDYDFCERPPAQITGTVFADRDGDCLLDPTEVGIDGVQVELYDSNGNLVATASTDSSGRYRFTNLPAGEYTVREIQPIGWLQGAQMAGSGGGDDSAQDVISAINIGWGDRLIQYNFCEVEPSSIAGNVHVDADGDCVRDPDEDPIAGVRIDLFDGNGRIVATTTTNANGEYRFDNLEPGDYQIFEHQPSGYFQGGQTLGSGGGEILGDDLLALSLGAGVKLVNYDFCEVPPAEISGKVWSDVDLDRTFDPGETPLAGVLIELVDQSGTTIATTTTDRSGCYEFTGLRPGVYSIRETQPTGYFHGGQVVGDSGGSIGGDDWLVDIDLTGGLKASEYNFPEVPPAKISGFVFQDGENLQLAAAPDPADLRLYRDGLLTDDDTRLSGVTIELRNVFGQPFEASNALPGSYSGDTIRVTTDANGYYEFTGLRQATYHVYQVQPDDYIDGLDTPGTTGGIAVNPADVIQNPADLATVQTLSASDATNPNDDAIINIFLTAGDESVLNNFSEIRVDPSLPPPLVQGSSDPDPVTAPIQTFERPVLLVGYYEPYTIKSPALDEMEWAVSWHLSVINGGFPRGVEAGQNVIRQVGARINEQTWREAEGSELGQHAKGRWTFMTKDGTVRTLENVSLGEDEATALAGDFDGDGTDEMAIYVAGDWFIDVNGNGLWDQGDIWVALGTSYDRPVVGDWDGDGKDDVGIFGRQWERDPERVEIDPGLPDPANRRRSEVDLAKLASVRDQHALDDDEQKRLLRRGTEGELRSDVVDHVFQYGEQVDEPLVGDWNGDGIDQIATFRGGRWLIDDDGDGRWTRQDKPSTYGTATDHPVVGDFNGDGIDEIAVVRGDVWIIDTDGDRKLTENDRRIEVPKPSSDSQPITADLDGDGKDEPGYYDEAG